MAAATRGSSLLGAGEEPPTTRPCAGVGAYEADTGLFGAAMTGLGAGVELAFARVWPLPEKLSDLGLPKQLPMMRDVESGDMRRRERFREGGELRGPWVSELTRAGWLAERWAWEGLGGREVCGANGVGVCRGRKDF